MSTSALQRTLVFLYLGIDMVCFAICIFLVARLNVEKHLDADHDAILAHQKAQVLAEGGTWVDPAERARLEQEEADKEAEEARVRELEETCRRKGLDFAKENEKYLARREKQKNAPLGKLLGL